jgi:uncharacterized lipoprotein YbaY
MDVVAEAVKAVYDAREQTRGLRGVRTEVSALLPGALRAHGVVMVRLKISLPQNSHVTAETQRT